MTTGSRTTRGLHPPNAPRTEPNPNGKTYPALPAQPPARTGEEGQAPSSVRLVDLPSGETDGSKLDGPPPSRRAFASDDPEAMPGAPVADPLIGVVVAERYRIVELLGRGGMGIVYKVEHSRIGKLLAMKLLTGELSRNREVVRRFKQEALTASKLSSPNTVQVFDFGVAEGLTYLVMELVAGEDLARSLRANGPMPFARLGKIVIQVCSSLSEAHHQGIVHRDMKPENVMLVRAPDGTDVAKVLDFGLAKLREGADLNDVTSQGAIVGTPYFMAPEQIRGERVDARTDIYALGALLYRGLTGHYPFNGTTPMAVFTKHLTDEPIPPSARAPELGIPPRVSALVLRALAKEPAARFQTVEELRHALAEELRLLGNSSIRDLLDSTQMRKLSTVASEADARARDAHDIATRDEVERYERKLRRRVWWSAAAGTVLVAGLAVMGVKLFYLERAQLRRGHELEPNDTAAQATPIPFDEAVTGHLGPRIDPAHGDRDFYSFTVSASPAGGEVPMRVTVTALPNIAMCTLLYKQGLDTPLGQYCVGRAGRPLGISALRLEPGRYFVAILQDMDPYGGVPPYVHENVSDTYALTVGPATVDAAREEVEPNDQIASATPVAMGAPMTGALAWVRDVDVFCASPGAPAFRWKVTDAARDMGVVLEATPIDGPGSLERAPVRVHGSASGKVSAMDAVSPWISAPVAPSGDAPRCLRVRAVASTWGASAAGGVGGASQPVAVPTGAAERYTIELVP